MLLSSLFTLRLDLVSGQWWLIVMQPLMPCFVTLTSFCRDHCPLWFIPKKPLAGSALICDSIAEQKNTRGTVKPEASITRLREIS
jgi:hypothetical protein